LFYSWSTPAPRTGELLYIGKYSAAKGLPWLLDAVEQLSPEHPGLVLNIAGSGAGAEAEALRRRMENLTPMVVLHGQLDQPSLAQLMRRCTVCVLPSFYEGVPLVLVEAAASGCRIVASALPGVIEQIEPHLGSRIELVPLPRLETIDTPAREDLPRFTHDLKSALGRAIGVSRFEGEPDLAHFTWNTVFGRVQNIWQDLLA
jgi:glycosyltransferase involved in cell wall biosynthesis